MKTNIVVVLDRSGSMYHIAEDTIGGYNSYLQEQQSMALPDDRWTLIQFADDSVITVDSLPLDLVPELTPETYRADGPSTSLLDAMGTAISSIQEAPDTRTLLVVCTDGQENSSMKFTLDQIKQLVETKEKQGNWTFVFLGAGIDAFNTGISTGMTVQSASGNTLSYAASGQAQAQAWNSVSSSTRVYRGATGQSMGSTNQFFSLAEEEEEDGAATS